GQHDRDGNVRRLGEQRLAGGGSPRVHAYVEVARPELAAADLTRDRRLVLLPPCAMVGEQALLPGGKTSATQELLQHQPPTSGVRRTKRMSESAVSESSSSSSST